MEREWLEHRNPHVSSVECIPHRLCEGTHRASLTQVNDWRPGEWRVERGAFSTSGVSDNDFQSRDNEQDRRGKEELTSGRIVALPYIKWSVPLCLFDPVHCLLIGNHYPR